LIKPAIAPADEPAAGAVLRILLWGVAFAAGLTGMFLLAWPGSTARYFSWDLDPEPLASLIGGSYVASLLVFGIAARRSWPEVRGLVAGTLALTIPMLAVTFFHLEVFDFGRWQAWAWVVLFLASPLVFGSELWSRRGIRGGDGDLLAPGYRLIAGLLGVVFLSVAVSLWWDPEQSARLLPFELPPFGGRVLGCWSSFLGFLALWTAARARAAEVRVPLVGVTLFMAGAIGGAMRNLDELQPAGRRIAYVTVLGGLLIITAICWLAAMRAPRRT
jgi:hypothetical protein